MTQPPLIVEGIRSYQIGDSERLGADLAIAFKGRGYRAAVFALDDSDGPIRRELESSGVECVNLNRLRRPGASRGIGFQLELFRFLVFRKARALHIHGTAPLQICGIPAWLARVPRVVATVQSIHQYSVQQEEWRIAQRYWRYASVLTGVDAGITEYFRDIFGVPSDRLNVVPNGAEVRAIDPVRRQTMRRRLGIPDQSFVFLSAGCLEPANDVHTLLRAVAQLPRGLTSRVVLFLVGEGSCRDELEAAGAALGISDCVHFLGARMDTASLMDMADAFVMTSRTEALPMAMIDAMGAGLPCISTAVGGAQELIANGAGLLAPATDSQGIAYEMARLMASDALCEKLAASGRGAIAERHSRTEVLSRYLELMGLPANWSPSI